MSNEPGILPEPIPFGKYYLLERISVGGMAEIYKAKAFGVEGFERLLAVKKILSSIAEDESFIEMFIDEAKIAGQLNHPNIAQIFDLGKVDGSYFIALEYISGKDMKTIFERARRVGEEVNIPQVCYVLMKVCEGLQHAHDKKDSQGRDLNIVHRDISPQNILISYEGEVKIIDFGIAKAQGKTSQTQVGVLKGKFSYMSPEQVRGLHVDHRSDIFSLGIVLYEMLTLERLFLGESDFDTLEKIRKVEMSPPSLYNPNIPKELEDIVLKALAQNPDERYQSAGDLAHAIERFMRNQDYFYKNTDLADFMKDAFQEDIEFEKKKLEYYKSLDLKPPDQLPDEEEEEEEDGGLVWDEEEMETQIFDRGDSAPQSNPAAAAQSQSGSHAAQSQSGSHNAASQSGGHAAQSGAHASQSNSQVQSPNSGVQRRSSSHPTGRGEAVEVVGPDDEVDVVGPDEGVEAGASQTGPNQQGGDPATVEYDRWSVEEELEDMEAEVGGEPAGEQRQSRRNQATAQVGSDEMPIPGDADPHRGSGRRSKDGYGRWAVVGGTATVLVVAALAIIYTMTGGGWFDSKAHIQFSTSPEDVQIFINGEKVHDGATPFEYNAEPGATEIVIDQEGYTADERSRELAAGTSYRLQATLEKADDTGEIFVKSTPPGATVTVDGETIDDPTPVTVDSLSAGTRRIVVKKDGFLEDEHELELDVGASEELEVELRPKQVMLNIKSEPDGARYRVYAKGDDEVASGRTPGTVEELDGEKTYRVEIESSGYEDWEENFEPGSEKETSLTAELEKTSTGSSGSPTVAANNSNSGSSGNSGSTESAGTNSGGSGLGSAGSESGGDDASGSTGSTGSSGGGDGASTTTSTSKTEGSTEEEEPKEPATLNISSRPAARVYIDGTDTGEYTPLLNYKVEPGSHEIRLTNDEFGLDKTRYVDVKPGETKKILNKSK